MVKHTQTIRQLLLMNRLSDYFVGLALKGLTLFFGLLLVLQSAQRSDENYQPKM